MIYCGDTIQSERVWEIDETVVHALAKLVADLGDKEQVFFFRFLPYVRCVFE